jgi:hypothetical protein
MFMKAKLLAQLALLSFLMQLVFCANLPDDQQDPKYWLRRKAWFYKRTRFDLTDDNLKLLGPRRLIGQNKASQPVGHLPFWFDYELFKKVFNKQSASPEEEEARHNTFINTCVRVLKARVLFRMLAGTSDTFITSDADKVSTARVPPLPANQRSTNSSNYLSSLSCAT